MKDRSANAATFDWAKYWEAKGMKRTYAHRPRAQWNNYKWQGTYLITIVTHRRKRVLGELINTRMELTDAQNARVELTNIGQFVEQEWLSIPAKQGGSRQAGQRVGAASDARPFSRCLAY